MLLAICKRTANSERKSSLEMNLEWREAGFQAGRVGLCSRRAAEGRSRPGHGHLGMKHVGAVRVGAGRLEGAADPRECQGHAPLFGRMKGSQPEPWKDG